MKRLKYFSSIIIILLFILNIGCERNVDPAESDDDTNSEYIENSDDYVWDSLATAKITLNNSNIEVTGSNVSVTDNIIIIQSAGTYLFNGTLNNGQIKIQATDTETVKLVLNNVTLTCSNDAPIYVEDCGKAIIILTDNSTNTISDGSIHTTTDVNAAIFSKSDLVITGNGTLNVKGNINDAIASKDGLVINNGKYNITAVDDGIRGKDFIIIKSGTFTLDVAGDAFKSDNEDTGFGYIQIDDGEFDIESGDDGINAFNNLTITNGTYTIVTNNSGKGIKAGTNLDLKNGTFTITAIDDAIHSENDLQILNGNFIISTSDDGIHAENELQIENGNIVINKSYEGIEAKTIIISDGKIYVTSSDDGINAVSGEGESFPGSGGGNSNFYMQGGFVAVTASGDGIDINGSIQMSGGTLIVHGPTSNGNGALDYDGSFTISAGLLVGAGSSGMAQAPGGSSTQYSVLINFTSSFSANTLFNLQDASGNSIATFSPSKSYQSVVISSPELKSGTSYNIYYNGSTSGGTETEGLYTDAAYTPGTLYQSFTISSITTTIGSSGGPGGGRR